MPDENFSKPLSPPKEILTTKNVHSDGQAPKNMLKFLLKLDDNGAVSKQVDNVTNKIEAEPDKLDEALSVYNNCPTTLNKILLSSKNPIIVDTSYQPGNKFIWKTFIGVIGVNIYWTKKRTHSAFIFVISIFIGSFFTVSHVKQFN